MNVELELNQIITLAKESSDPRKKREAVLKFLKELPPHPGSLKAFELAYKSINEIDDAEERRSAVLEIERIIPRTDEFSSLYAQVVDGALNAVMEINHPVHRKSAFLRIAGDIPVRPEFNTLYERAVRLSIDSADKIADPGIRRYSLVDCAGRLRQRGGFDRLAVHAYRVAMGIAEEAGYRKYSLEDIMRELPKSSDYTFYRNNTFLGIAVALPKKGEFLKLYKEAIRLAIKASLLVAEPYYRKYALLFIAQELPKTEEFTALYRESLEEAFNASLAIKEPFPRQFAFLEILKEVPKTEYFSPLMLKAIEASLPFFSVKSRMQDVEVVEVIDYIIVAEEKKISDSKKRRAIRERYAQDFSKVLEEFVGRMNDVRMLEILKPYTHVWIRPLVFRDTVRKVAGHLSGLKQRYHGREIERPVFVKEEHPSFGSHIYLKGEKALSGDTLSIDLGATNTVIMRKKGDNEPEFIVPDVISKRYGDTYTVPTLITPETDSIGMEAEEKANALNIKKMLLERDPMGKDLMERYLNILYRHIKRTLPQTGWLQMLSGTPVTRIRVTVPVGFGDYRKELERIITRVARGVKVDFVEEPLAAAIGYQVAEEKDKLVLVMDFGGCTLDTMLLRMSVDEVYVVAKPDRSRMLGGKDIDLWLAGYLAKKCGLKEGELPPQLILRAEEIKIALSDYRIVPFEWDGAEVCKVTREDLENILSERDFYKDVDREISYVLKKGKKLGISKETVDAVILTGGSSQIPSFKEKIAHNFPELMKRNAVYDHSPLTAVARGAALYGTSGVIDRHLGMAYALRFATKGKEKHHSHEIILEKGESLPFEKTFRVRPARCLGEQSEVFLELLEIPESLITRRWIRESEMEFIKQFLKLTDEEVELKGFNIITLPLEDTSRDEGLDITFCVNEKGDLKLRHSKDNKELDTAIRLQ
ncbi:MAG: Hsp70 family protein [Deltaproteobacteria bacterium]|nr:Hsp70 family protein [Deltaproteobacteria bacterium]